MAPAAPIRAAVSGWNAVTDEDHAPVDRPGRYRWGWGGHRAADG